MPETVYIETSVPSAHVSRRGDPSSLHRKAETQKWWSSQLPLYNCYVSENVFIELREGDWPGQQEALELIAALKILPASQEVRAVAGRYITEKLVPDDMVGDASHLAYACVYEVDFLLTWNIRHLANPNKQQHLVVINRRLGLMTPQIVTPEMLWKEAGS